MKLMAKRGRMKIDYHARHLDLDRPRHLPLLLPCAMVPQRQEASMDTAESMGDLDPREAEDLPEAADSNTRLSMGVIHSRNSAGQYRAEFVRITVEGREDCVSVSQTVENLKSDVS